MTAEFIRAAQKAVQIYYQASADGMYKQTWILYGISGEKMVK